MLKALIISNGGYYSGGESEKESQMMMLKKRREDAEKEKGKREREWGGNVKRGRNYEKEAMLPRSLI